MKWNTVGLYEEIKMVEMEKMDRGENYIMMKFTAC
jgi:hypothetical protein